MKATHNSGGILGYASLFTSLGTLLCCALPSLLVLLGLGATVASVISTASWLNQFVTAQELDVHNSWSADRC